MPSALSSGEQALGEEGRLALRLGAEQLHQGEAAEVVAHCPQAPQRREDACSSRTPTLRPCPGEDGLAEADGRVGQGRGDVLQPVRGGRDGRPGPRRPGRPRSRSPCWITTSLGWASARRLGLGRRRHRAGVDPEQAVQRDAEVQLAPEVHQARRGPRWSGAGSDGPAGGAVTSATTRGQRQPFAAAAGRSRRLTSSVAGLRPVGPARICVHSARYPSGAGRSKKPRAAAGEDRAVPAVDVRLELRAAPVAATPIRFQQSSTAGPRRAGRSLIGPPSVARTRSARRR